MIKFFRQLRQRMIKDNRVSKYLLYALGEIMLVVIGIFLALQLNNWNEGRKQGLVEEKMLIELRSNLAQTLASFEADTLRSTALLAQLEAIQRFLTNDEDYHSGLDTAFGQMIYWPSPYPIMTGYKNLESKGIDLISNETLRTTIAGLYEYHLPLLTQDYDRYEWQLSQSLVIPVYNQHIGRLPGKPGLAAPNVIDDLKNSNDFSNLIGLLITTRKSGIGMYRRAMTKIQKTMQEIDLELESDR